MFLIRFLYGLSIAFHVVFYIVFYIGFMWFWMSALYGFQYRLYNLSMVSILFLMWILYDFECGLPYDYECGHLYAYECRNDMTTHVAIVTYRPLCGWSGVRHFFFVCFYFSENIVVVCGHFWAFGTWVFISERYILLQREIQRARFWAPTHFFSQKSRKPFIRK